jgi:hypothetical protein
MTDYSKMTKQEVEDFLDTINISKADLGDWVVPDYKAHKNSVPSYLSDTVDTTDNLSDAYSMINSAASLKWPGVKNYALPPEVSAGINYATILAKSYDTGFKQNERLAKARVRDAKRDMAYDHTEEVGSKLWHNFIDNAVPVGRDLGAAALMYYNPHGMAPIASQVYTGRAVDNLWDTAVLSTYGAIKSNKDIKSLNRPDNSYIPDAPSFWTMVGAQGLDNGNPNTPLWKQYVNLFAGGNSQGLDMVTEGTKATKTGGWLDDPNLIKTFTYDNLNRLINQARASNKPVPQHALDELERKRNIR